ncbi:radical SAM protein [bacterium]|nr:radical SAM protein [bacterium]
MNSIIKNFIQAPVIKMEKLDNFFIELSKKACNMKCKHCYIPKNSFIMEKDFLEFKKIKTALKQIKDMNVKMIYLTGGEPTIHPDFNQIIRLCLKISSVCTITNGQTINEKKARFLKKIDNESAHESIYVISFEHFEEAKNDALRGRGSYRKAVHALSCLIKYGFNPIVQVTDYYKESKEALLEGFSEIYKKLGAEFEDINLKITPYFSEEHTIGEYKFDPPKADPKNLDCATTRIFTSKGVYTCPILSGDFRARMGTDMSDFSHKCTADTKMCTQCIEFGAKAFSANWI